MVLVIPRSDRRLSAHLLQTLAMDSENHRK